MVSFLRPPLEKLGCECYFAKSYREISELLSRNKLNIMLSLNCYQNLSEMMPLLAGQCVSMFQVLRVEKGAGGFLSFKTAWIASGHRLLVPRNLLRFSPRS